MKILIVDDSQFIRKQIEDIIISMQMNTQIISLETGEQAIDFLKDNDADVIFLDIILPGIEGFEVLKFVRKTKDYGDIYIIVMTSIDDDEVIKKSFSIGANDFIRKPINPVELAYRLRAAIRLRNYQYLYKSAYDDLQEKNKRLIELTKKLKETQDILIHNEKMSAIGQLAAGIAHEINNPLGFVITNIEMLNKYFDRIKQILEEYDRVSTKMCKGGALDLEMIKNDCSRINEHKKSLKIDFIIEDLSQLMSETMDGLSRVSHIVQTLKKFARSGLDNKATFEDINQIIEETLLIARNELKYDIEIEKDYQDVDNIYCNRGEIGQVILNILINAAQAIKSQPNRKQKGHIKIMTFQDQEYVYCSISDDGPGIKKIYLNKIFEPFFTTKDVGQGTGLGLSISYDIIVNKHGGDIQVESEEGRGATFTIKLPKYNKDQK